MKKRILFAGILIIAAVAVLIYYGANRNVQDSGNKKLDGVSSGNMVEVNYVGTLENGTIFDTNLADVAKEDGSYNPLRSYEPLSFVVGEGQMIKGFDEGIKGMKVGEKKTLILSPEEAYGEYNPQNVEVIPRIETINRTMEINKSLAISKTQFSSVFGSDPKVGEEYETAQMPWKYLVSQINGDQVLINISTKKGEVFTLPQMPWSSEVLEVGVKIKIRHNPKSGQIVPTAFGNATLEVSDKEIKIKVDPKIGEKAMLQFGQATVIDFNKTSIILDLNHPLAGKTLKFEVEIVNVSEAPSSAGLDLGQLDSQYSE